MAEVEDLFKSLRRSTELDTEAGADLFKDAMEDLAKRSSEFATANEAVVNVNIEELNKAIDEFQRVEGGLDDAAAKIEFTKKAEKLQDKVSLSLAQQMVNSTAKGELIEAMVQEGERSGGDISEVFTDYLNQLDENITVKDFGTIFENLGGSSKISIKDRFANLKQNMSITDGGKFTSEDIKVFEKINQIDNEGLKRAIQDIGTAGDGKYTKMIERLGGKGKIKDLNMDLFNEFSRARKLTDTDGLLSELNRIERLKGETDLNKILEEYGDADWEYGDLRKAHDDLFEKNRTRRRRLLGGAGALSVAGVVGLFYEYANTKKAGAPNTDPPTPPACCGAPHCDDCQVDNNQWANICGKDAANWRDYPPDYFIDGVGNRQTCAINFPKPQYLNWPINCMETDKKKCWESSPAPDEWLASPCINIPKYKKDRWPKGYGATIGLKGNKKNTCEECIANLSKDQLGVVGGIGADANKMLLTSQCFGTKVETLLANWYGYFGSKFCYYGLWGVTIVGSLWGLATIGHLVYAGYKFSTENLNKTKSVSEAYILIFILLILINIFINTYIQVLTRGGGWFACGKGDLEGPEDSDLILDLQKAGEIVTDITTIFYPVSVSVKSAFGLLIVVGLICCWIYNSTSEDPPEKAPAAAPTNPAAAPTNPAAAPTNQIAGGYPTFLQKMKKNNKYLIIMMLLFGIMLTFVYKKHKQALQNKEYIKQINSRNNNNKLKEKKMEEEKQKVKEEPQKDIKFNPIPSNEIVFGGQFVSF